MVEKNEKLRRWAAKYKKVLIERSGNKCERCKKQFTEEEHGMIHHIVYKKDINGLLFVCHNCHKAIHIKQDQKSFLRRLVTWLNDDFPDEYTIKQLKWEAKEELKELGKDKDVP